MSQTSVAPRIAGFLSPQRGGVIRPYTTRTEYVRHARLLWRTAMQFKRLGDTVLWPDYAERAKGLLVTARTVEGR